MQYCLEWLKYQIKERIQLEVEKQEGVKIIATNKGTKAYLMNGQQAECCDRKNNKSLNNRYQFKLQIRSKLAILNIQQPHYSLSSIPQTHPNFHDENLNNFSISYLSFVAQQICREFLIISVLENSKLDPNRTRIWRMIKAHSLEEYLENIQTLLWSW